MRRHRPPRGLRHDGHLRGGGRLATYQELADFLASVERRAYKHVLFAVRDDQLALDVVQDAMLKLTEKYAARPPAELPLIFQRILQTTILDFHRRRNVRSRWTLSLSSLTGDPDNDETDPLDTLRGPEDTRAAEIPAEQAQQAQIIEIIEKALVRLPTRQRQAFLLRYWEELDVAEVAKVMGCSEGSVKTHCSRAIRALSDMLGKQGLRL